MLPRERVCRAIAHQAPDVVPLRIYAAPGGLLEHGQPLVDLIQACGHDFGPLEGVRVPDPPGPEDRDPDGRYHAVRTDAWGTTWEYRIYGVWGHPIAWPLADLSRVATYRAPAPPPDHGPEVDAARSVAADHMKTWFLLGGGGSLFHTLHSLRPFEDLLVDIAEDAPAIHQLADIVTEHLEGVVRHSLAVGADGIAFGDDFGTQDALIFSLPLWRRFFRPRYERLFAPILQAGKRIFFHSCGQIGPLLEELRALGVDVIWPQLNAFDATELARRCRDLGLAVELHPDRGDLMQRSTPDDVRRYLHRLIETFDSGNGGSWLYIEVDPGFPWPNVQALFETAMELRGSAATASSGRACAAGW